MRCPLLALAIALLSCTCTPLATFAPPIRTSTFGAPGHLEAGAIEVGVGGDTRAMYDGGLHGGLGPTVVGAPTEWFAVEFGSYFGTAALVGTVGTRLTPKNYSERGRSFALDVAFGGGAGVGGVRCGNQVNHWYDEDHKTVMYDGPCPDDVLWDGKPARERTATGGYFEIGLGLRVTRRVMFYWRPQAQMSWAEGVAPTAWGAFVFGPHFKFGTGDVHFGGGPAIFGNKDDYEWHFALTAGVSLLLGS